MDSTPTDPPKKKKAKKKKTDPKEVTGTVVHAVASKVLGEHVAKTTFGNVNFNKTYLEGRVVGIEDRRKKPESPASIYIVADYTVHGRDTPKRAVIFKGGVKLGPVPEDLNPKVRVTHPDSVDVRDAPTKGSTTYIANADGGEPLPNTNGAAASLPGRQSPAAGVGPNVAVSNRTHDVSSSSTPILAAAASSAAPAQSAPPSVPPTNNIAVVTTAGSSSAASRTSATSSVHTLSTSRASSVVSSTTSSSSAAASTAAPPSDPSAVPPSTQGKRKRGDIDLDETPMFVDDVKGRRHRVVDIAHGKKWVVGDASSIFGDVAKGKPSKQWYQKGPCDEKVYPGNKEFEEMTPLESYLMMYPKAQLELCITETNKNLAAAGHAPIDMQELLRWQGICLLITRTNYNGKRQNLWGGKAQESKYLPSIDLNKTPMGRNRFDAIWYAMRWSRQVPERPDNMTSEEWRWQLIDDHVDNFNKHRASTFVPSGEICADESVVRWYGLGGAFVNFGLPMYVELERKPDSGCEIQDICCVQSKVMLQLKIVQSSEQEERKQAAKNPSEEYAALNHGTKVLLELCEPWNDTGRLVVADSYFASVMSAGELKKRGWKFIGNVKTASKMFPKGFLENIVLTHRGARFVLCCIDEETGETEYVAVTWLDRNRRFFIATVCGLGEGTEISRLRYRQVDENPEADPDQVMINVNQPLCVESYYDGAGAVDQRNRLRAAELRVDKSLATKDWSRRVNFGIWGVAVCDSYALYQQVVHADLRFSSPHEYFCKLADQLIDNTEGVRVTRASAQGAQREEEPAAAARPKQVPQTKKKKSESSKGKARRANGRCKLSTCSEYSSYICSECTTNHVQYYVCCEATTGRKCWEQHLREEHNITE